MKGFNQYYCDAYWGHNCGKRILYKKKPKKIYKPICCFECENYGICKEHRCENDPKRCGKVKRIELEE